MGANLRLKLEYDWLRFEGEGDADAVFKARDQWLQENKAVISELTHKKEQAKGVVSDAGHWPLPTPPKPEDGSELQSLFRKDDKGNFSLKAIFTGSERVADAALLLLFGYKQIQESDEIFAVRLKSNLKDSGYTTLGRLDREMVKLKEQGFVNPFGEKRSRKYRITSEGIRRGKELAEEMAQLV